MTVEQSADGPQRARLIIIHPVLTIAEDVFVWAFGLKRGVVVSLTALTIEIHLHLAYIISLPSRYNN